MSNRNGLAAFMDEPHPDARPGRAMVLGRGGGRGWSQREARSLLSLGGPVIYAVQLPDGIIKIGHTTDLNDRLDDLCGVEGKLLGFRFGDRVDETRVHRALVEFRARPRAREYYHPTSEVIGTVNVWRSDLGLDLL
jgi:hypothetical protein